MSHNPERKEKDCLNCGAVVYGRFCHICGQENIETKESFWHLFSHFVYDITHFDSKFFSSVKYLLLKPGYLSIEYIRGKRVSYLNPIKMYVFISAFFFLFFFSVINPTLTVGKKKQEYKSATEAKQEINERLKDFKEGIEDKETPVFARKIMENQIVLLERDLERIEKDSTDLKDLTINRSISDPLRSKYKDVKYYDSLQNSLPADKRDSWLEKALQRKKLAIGEKYGDDQSFGEKLAEKYLHTFPQVMFISLPLFALILQLLYAKRKEFYYADHGIFTVHLYSAMFILMFFILSFNHFSEKPYFNWLEYLVTPLFIYIVWYQYKAMRNFYGQSRKKTILKYLLLLIMSTIVMPVLFILFLILSIFNM